MATALPNNFIQVDNLDPPPINANFLDRDGKISVPWIRWLTSLWDRVGGSSGQLLYDAAIAAQMSAALSAQLSAVRATLSEEIKDQILFAINQVSLQKADTVPALNLSIGAPQDFTPLAIGQMAMYAASALAGANLTLDQVLNNGSVSTHSISTGNSTVTGTLAVSSTSTFGGNMGVTGNVTITNPSASLVQVTTGDVTSGGSVYHRFNDVNGNAGFVGFGGSTSTLNLYNYKTGPIIFSTNALSRMTIDGQGAVTINNPTVGVGLTIAGGGATVTGTVAATAFSGDGSLLTALNATQITTGNLSVNRLNSGTGASGSTYWRGDGTWAAAPAPAITDCRPYIDNFVATAAQTVFNTTQVATLAAAGGRIYQTVYLNGVLQIESAAQYTVTGAHQITLAVGAALNDNVTVIGWSH